MQVEASKKFPSRRRVSDVLSSAADRLVLMPADGTPGPRHFPPSSAGWHNVAHRGTLIRCPTTTPSASRQGHEHASPSMRVELGCLSGRSPNDISKRDSGTTHTR